jgi:hypothetical protein
MTLSVLHLFLAAVALSAFLASITIWSPRNLGVKLVAVAAAALIMPLAYASFASLLSRPKPINLEWARGVVADANVLSSMSREDEGIYLWLQLPDVAEPRSYVLPWSRSLAQQLQDAKREAERRGSGVMMRLPFEPSIDDREPKFYAMPQPAMPPKDYFAPPERFHAPDKDA